MLAILSSLNAHSFPIFQPILMILVSKFMVHRALSDKTYLLLGLLSPLKGCCTGSSESIHVKMQHCWKSRVAAHIIHFRRKISKMFLSDYFEFIKV